MLEMSWIVAVMSFAVLTTGTPGPNNVMLTASGARFGYRRTLPHLFGIALGLAIMSLLVSAGLGSIITSFPTLMLTMKVAGSAYLLWLAWQLLNIHVGNSHDERGKPMTLLQAAAFQWVNPKAWMMCLGAVSSFVVAKEHFWLHSGVLATMFLLTSLLCCSCWAAFGQWLSRCIHHKFAQRMIGLVLSVLTVSCIYLMW